MKALITKVGFFIGGIMMFIIIGLLLPPTPRASTSLFFSKMQKDSLLLHVPSPRLILVGGSNISMSINSQILRDSLHLHPINMGIAANLGLAYMVDHTLKGIQKGDIVIVSPEYSQFYNSLAYGTEDLTRMILDTSPREIFSLRPKQLRNMIQHIPAYALSKFRFAEYFDVNNDDEIYTRQSFNKYGDLDKHWNLSKRDFQPMEPIVEPIDEDAITILEEYKIKLEDKGAMLFITFPAFHVDSYNNQKLQIRELQRKLRDRGFAILGYPQRYIVEDDVMFDSFFHLTRNGVVQRTNLLIEDIKKKMPNNYFSYEKFDDLIK